MKIDNVTYDINWRSFRRGTSFFIPCLDTQKAKLKVTQVTKRMGVKVLQKVEIAEGIIGVRVWRL